MYLLWRRLTPLCFSMDERSYNFSMKEEPRKEQKTETVTNKKKVDAWNNLTKEYNSVYEAVFKNTIILKSKYIILKK